MECPLSERQRSAGFTAEIDSGYVSGHTVWGRRMAYAVDFDTVSTVGLESSPVAVSLPGLRANEARFVKNKWAHGFTVEPASNAQTTID
jgi:hypothetical protein